MAENAAARVVNRGKTLRNFNRFARTELRQGGRVPLRTRLWALRRGFLSTSVGLYDLTEESCSQYVSDWSRYIKSARINGRFASALNNKIVFSRMLQGYGCDVPEYYCLIRDGVMHQIGSRYRMRTPDDVLAACRAGGRFIVKPSSGSGGISVSALCSEDDGLTVNGEACADEILIEFLADLDEGIIEEYIQQHDYAERIFPHSANSIRVLTMWDVDRREPFIACAVHRFGTRTPPFGRTEAARRPPRHGGEGRRPQASALGPRREPDPGALPPDGVHPVHRVGRPHHAGGVQRVRRQQLPGTRAPGARAAPRRPAGPGLLREIRCDLGRPPAGSCGPCPVRGRPFLDTLGELRYNRRYPVG